MFAFLVVMDRMDDNGVLNHSITVIDCPETLKPYE